jgi:integrase
MKRTHYIACYKKNKNDTIGYLFLQSKGRKNRAKKALGISIKYELFLKYFNEKEQCFKSGLENYKLINEKIASELGKMVNEEVKLENSKTKKSFLKYWQSELNLETNVGSKIKYQGIKTKFEKYLASIGKNDVSFNELTPDFFKKVQFYFKTARDPKPLSPNSATQYLKVIGIFLNRKIENDPYLFKVHPLTGISYGEKKPVQRKVLDDNEIVRLHSTKLDSTELEFYRDMFLFQLFANGMRVSDLLLLRWNTFDLENQEITYRMFKRPKDMTVPFSYFMSKALLTVSGFPWAIELAKLKRFQFGGRMIKPENISGDLKKYTVLPISVGAVEYRGYHILSSNDTAKRFIDAFFKAKEEQIKYINEDAANKIKQILHNGKNENDFVFPILNLNHFEGVSNNENTFKEQVATDPNLYRLLLNGEKKYRTKLEKIAEQCKIKKMPSHSARHTFAKLLDLEGAPTHDIKDKLGHTTLDTTANYMAHIKDKKNSNTFIKKLGNKTDYLDS